MPKIHGWFSNPPELPWEQESVAFLYDSKKGPLYYSYPMTGLVPYNEPDAADLRNAPAPLWIAYLDPRKAIGKIDARGDKTYVIDLPTSFDEYLESLPYNHRKEMRYLLRKNSDVEVVENARDDVTLLWPEYEGKLVERCIAEGETPFSAEGLELLRSLFHDPLTYVLSFRIGGTLFAVNISFRRDGIVYDSTCLRTRVDEVRNRGLGNLAILKNIEYAIRDGFTEYDMLTGDWGYKHKFNAKPRNLKHYLKCSASFAQAYDIPIEEVSELVSE